MVQVPNGQPCFQKLAITHIFEAANVQQAAHALRTLLSMPAICSLLDGRVHTLEVKTRLGDGCYSNNCHRCMNSVVSRPLLPCMHAMPLYTTLTCLLLAVTDA